MSKQNVQLSPPWDTYFKMVYNLLSVDPEIKMPKTIREGEGGNYSFWIESGNSEKIIALSKILKNEIKMGNITITVSFRCTDSAITKVSKDVITVEDFDKAFKGNPLFYKALSEACPGGSTFFAIFKHDIITFYNDDISDYKCNAHFIIADLVEEVINDCAINICTEYEEEM